MIRALTPIALALSTLAMLPQAAQAQPSTPVKPAAKNSNTGASKSHTNNHAAGHEGGREYVTLKLSKGILKYALILPEGYDKDKAYPVIIALPPGPQNEAMVEAGLSRYWEAEAKKRGWVVASPLNPSWAKFFDATPGPVAGLMDELDRTMKVENHTFHIVGVSNGGRAAFIGALQEPGKVASITVLPGLVAENVSAAQLKPLAKVPVAMFVGASDRDWVEGAKASQTKLKEAGATVTLEEVPNSGHLVEISPQKLYDLLESRRDKSAPATPHAKPEATPKKQ